MKLIFLGTSAGMATNERNVSAIMLDLLKERGHLWLFDCGEATQHQMLKTKLSLAKLEKIFITHLHGDHLFGLPGLLRSRSLMNGMKPLTLYGPKGIKQYIEMVIDLSFLLLTYSLNIVEIEQPMTLFDDEQFTVVCDALSHRVPCFGYRIIEKDSPFQLEKGQVMDGKIFLSKVKKGHKIAILGDTVPCDAAINLAYDVDLLVHEATLQQQLQDKANGRGHSTTAQAALIAKQSRAKKLIITHISPRYKLRDNLLLVNECREIFPNTEIATDFYHVDIE